MNENNLSITKNNDREVSIILPSKNPINSKLSRIEYDGYVRRWIQALTDLAISNDLIFCLYKVKLQEIIVFDFRGNKENIEKLLKSFE